MHRLTRHLRGLLVALATLALSAGVVLAARPTSVEAPPAAAADGLSVAAEAAGKTVPVRAEQETLPEADEDADEDAPEVDEDAARTPTDAAGERPQNHGWFVSQAAKGATPAERRQSRPVRVRDRPWRCRQARGGHRRRDKGAAAAAAAKANKPAKAPKNH